MGKRTAIIDTDVLSYIFDQDPEGEPYLDIVGRFPVHSVAFASYMEMFYGAFNANWSYGRRSRLHAFLSGFELVETNADICVGCASLKAESEAIGKKMGHGDLWIAAVAQYVGCPLITNNRSDYEHISSLTILSVA